MARVETQHRNEEHRHGVICARASFPPVGDEGHADVLYRLPYVTYFAPHHHDKWNDVLAGRCKLPILVQLFGGGFLVGTSQFNHSVSGPT